MDEPILKKENTIGITYVVGKIEEPHFKHIIERILRVPELELEGIDTRGTARFIFKVKSNNRYESICEKFSERDIPIGNGNVIQVDDISSYGTLIEMSRIPFEVSNDMLSTMMQKYGDVYKCKYHFRQFGDYRTCKNS